MKMIDGITKIIVGLILILIASGGRWGQPLNVLLTLTELIVLLIAK